MKHLENREFDVRELKQELELAEVPAAVDRKLRQVYAELPAELPVKRRGGRGVIRGFAAAAGALAAAFLMLFGVNAMNPALAESLPVVGGVFQRINRPDVENVRAAHMSVAKYAKPVENASVQVPANGLLEKPLTVSVADSYFDGEFLYAGLTLEGDVSADVLYNDTNSEGLNITINGEKQIGFDEEPGLNIQLYQPGFGYNDLVAWQRDGGSYLLEQVIRVPEQYQDAESLEIGFCFEGIYKDPMFPEMSTVNSTPFTLSYTAEKNAPGVVRVDGDGLEMGGVRFLSASASVAGTSYTVEIPTSYNNPGYGASFEDGASIGYLAPSSQVDLGNGYIRDVVLESGLRENEDRKVVWKLFDKNGSDKYEAIFVIDFQNGTVSLGSEDDLVRIPSMDYYCGWENLQSFTEGYKIIGAWLKEQGEMIEFRVATDRGYRELTAELWQDGECLMSSHSANDNSFDKNFSYTDGDRNEQGEVIFYETDLNSQWFFFLGSGLDRTKPMTLKLYDDADGQLVLEETITLSEERTLEETMPQGSGE